MADYDCVGLMKYLAVGWMSVSSTRSGSLASECGDGWWERKVAEQRLELLNSTDTDGK